MTLASLLKPLPYFLWTAAGRRFMAVAQGVLLRVKPKSCTPTGTNPAVTLHPKPSQGLGV